MLSIDALNDVYYQLKCQNLVLYRQCYDEKQHLTDLYGIFYVQRTFIAKFNWKVWLIEK